MVSPERALHLARKAVYSRRMVSSLHPDYEDIVQEAALEILKVAERGADVGEGYYVQVARRRVVDLTTSTWRHVPGAWTGMDLTRRKTADPMRRGVDSLDREAELYPDQVLPLSDPAAERAVTEADWAALRPEIDAALSSVPQPAENLIRLMADGDGITAASRKVGLKRTTAARAVERARTKLQLRLGHLREELMAA